MSNDNDNYRSDTAHDRARLSQAEKIIADLREERLTRVYVLCQQCGHEIKVEDRKPGGEYCSPTCSFIARTRGQPGDIAYAPRDQKEREEHHRALRERRPGRT